MPTANAYAIPQQFHETHPLYRALARRWQQMRAAYLGGDAWYEQGETYVLNGILIHRASGTIDNQTHSPVYREINRLWRHPREKDWRYQTRLRASVYENMVRPFVTTMASTIARAAKKVVLPASMQYLELDVDRWHTDIAMARLHRIAWAHVYRHILVLLDKPEATAQPSRLHERAAGVRTYVQLVSPLDLLDWQWDAETQTFAWALLHEQRASERVSPDERARNAPADDPHYFTRLIKHGEWVRYRDGIEYARGPTGLDFVPLVVQFGLGRDPEQAEPIGIDLNGDLADKAEESFNRESWLTEQHMNTCFAQAVINAPDLATAELDRLVGTNTYVPAQDFRWVSPDVAPMQHLAESIERDKFVMRQMMGLDTKGETSQAAKSGLALQMEAQSTSSMFAGYAAAAESGERALWRTVALMEGADPDEVEVEYTRDFSALDVAARFGMVVEALKSGGFSGKAKAELQKLLFLAAHPDAEQDMLSEVFADIDEGAATLEAMPPPMPPESVAAPSNGSEHGGVLFG